MTRVVTLCEVAGSALAIAYALLIASNTGNEMAGFALLLDTTQTLWANALRAMHDKWFPTASHVISYVSLMVPLAWYLAFSEQRGSAGLFEALIVASVVSATALSWRFMRLAGKLAPTTPA